MPKAIVRVTKSLYDYELGRAMLYDALQQHESDKYDDGRDVLLSFDHDVFVAGSGEHTLLTEQSYDEPKKTVVIGFTYFDGYNKTKVYL